MRVRLGMNMRSRRTRVAHKHTLQHRSALEHGMRIRPVHVDLAHEAEACAILFPRHALDLLRPARLLAPELVAREREDLQAVAAILVVQRGQAAVILLCEAALARHVDDDYDVACERCKVDLGAVDIERVLHTKIQCDWKSIKRMVSRVTRAAGACAGAAVGPAAQRTTRATE